MKRTNELQQKILETMALKQVRNLVYGGGKPGLVIHDDDTPLFTYKCLEKELGQSVSRLRLEMHELRNEQLVVLSPAVNEDYIPNGSGWMLTDKALEYFDENFAKDL